MDLPVKSGRVRWTTIFALAGLLMGWPGTVQAGGLTSDGVISVSAGQFTTCAVRSGGTVWCWGSNKDGALGDGTLKNRSHPVQVVTGHGQPLTKAVAVSTGSGHSCVVRTSGDAWCWGYGFYGQLGTGNWSRPETQRRAKPVWASPGVLFTGVKAISVGNEHTCAVRTDGTVWCWGFDSDGELGDGGTPTYSTSNGDPTQVRKHGGGFLTDVTAVDLGAFHSCARRADGTMWCWGWDREGQLGDETLGGPDHARSRANEVLIAAGVPLTDVRSISAGGQHTCAVLQDRTEHCWGWDNEGELGDGTNGDIHNRRMYPVETAVGSGTLQHIRVIGAGALNSCAAQMSGDVWCWGDDSAGEDADGTRVGIRTSPIKVQSTLWGDPDAREVTVGEEHACALMANGSVWCWGEDDHGQLGDGTHGNHGFRLHPIKVVFQ